MNTKSYRFFDIILGIFIAVLLISNVASSAKIVDLGFSVLNIPMAFDAGTILFPIGYVFGDILTEVYGYQRSRRVIWTGFFSLALAALVFWVISILPGEVTWQGYAGDKAYQSILGGMSSGGIVLASLAGFWLGEFSNSFILAKMKILTRGRWLWSRTIGSTLVGELVDTVMFVVVASAFGVFPWSLFLTLTLTNYLFKVAVEVLMTPVTYLVVRALKRAEGEDYYDRDTNFNPFVMQ
ncbi:MAG: queuosine precursor transporter [Anaerolineales bacterium]|nr:queuosine precursor transporter [Anaerolineales bacterium]